MEGHTRFEHAVVARAQAHGALAPIWWIADTDWVTATAVLVDIELLKHAEEGTCDITSGVARLGGLEAGSDTFDDCFLAVDEMLRWLAQVNSSGQRAVIALVAAGDFEEGLKRRP